MDFVLVAAKHLEAKSQTPELRMTNARSNLRGLPVLNGLIDAALISLTGLKDKAAIDLVYVAFQLLHPLLDVQGLAALIGEGLK